MSASFLFKRRLELDRLVRALIQLFMRSTRFLDAQEVTACKRLSRFRPLPQQVIAELLTAPELLGNPERRGVNVGLGVRDTRDGRATRRNRRPPIATLV